MKPKEILATRRNLRMTWREYHIAIDKNGCRYISEVKKSATISDCVNQTRHKAESRGQYDLRETELLAEFMRTNQARPEPE